MELADTASVDTETTEEIDRPTNGQPAPETSRKSLPRAWLITAVAVVAIAAVGWFLLHPDAQAATTTASSDILATAPPAANAATALRSN